MTILESAKLMYDFYKDQPGFDLLSEDAIERLEALFDEGDDYEEDHSN